MNNEPKPECDLVFCSGKVFRGRNNCPGYSYTRFGWATHFYVCGCACHIDETREDTLKKIEQFKKENNL